MSFISNSFKNELRAKSGEMRFATTSMSNTKPQSIMATTSSPVSEDELESFSSHLKSSNRILALLGAGLSASSGLPTFRGAGGYWRNNDAVALASPDAFAADPGLVWQFYSYRRHMALRAKPNPAHLALAALARHKPAFLTISQNVDGLSPRANHPKDQLELLHGSLFDIRCTGFDCDYHEEDNCEDPIVPALDIPKDPSKPGEELDISNAQVPLRNIPPEELPHCPKCKQNLLRPAVVWFGEALPAATLDRVDAWMYGPDKIDLLLVIGTSALVYPAAGYIAKAKARGARIVVINTERPDLGASNLEPGDWFFQGDAGTVIPQILQSVTGPVSDTME